MDAVMRPGSNLSPGAASKRLRVAVIVLAITLAGAVAIDQAGLATPWRLLLFFPFLLSASGFYQGLYRT